MKKHSSILTLFIASLFLASCANDNKQVATSTTPPVAVTVKQVAENTNTPFLSVSGTIQAQNSADLSTRIMGYVENVAVNVGDTVTKGQLLLSINNTDLLAKKAQVNASITEATAAFNNAEKDYNRFQKLVAQNSASQKEMDDITANYEMAKARLEAAKQMKNEVAAQFAYSNIAAPFNGIITGKNVEEGQMANPGKPLISLEAPGRFEVMAMVPETEISQIKNNTQVTVLVSSINATLTGTVSEISTSAKNTGGQYLVKITLPQTQTPILSGMFVTVQFPVEKQSESQLILIPTSALVTQGQLSGVYTVSQSNNALLRWLRLGRTFGNQVEVLSGLSAEETIIIASEGKLFNGANITIK
ncbi:efflux RND transporter periplasmic adaptor subunit [Bizionia sediminis]|uniref:Efflux RND transporter periplasmic adaptor subunit n=1 Tax=Bizionia sediminis TaxID=1737064 RepID=A0ABW5KSK3_9FLAO